MSTTSTEADVKMQMEAGAGVPTEADVAAGARVGTGAQAAVDPQVLAEALLQSRTTQWRRWNAIIVSLPRFGPQMDTQLLTV